MCHKNEQVYSFLRLSVYHLYQGRVTSSNISFCIHGIYRCIESKSTWCIPVQTFLRGDIIWKAKGNGSIKECWIFGCYKFLLCLYLQGIVKRKRFLLHTAYNLLFKYKEHIYFLYRTVMQAENYLTFSWSHQKSLHYGEHDLEIIYSFKYWSLKSFFKDENC